MKSLQLLRNLLVRFRYPMSLPEDIANALGISLSNALTFDELIQSLVGSACFPQRIQKYMPRHEVEKAFNTAKKCERFGDRTLCSFCFNEGWIEFILKFDSSSKLRRIYLLSKEIDNDLGIEIHLSSSKDSELLQKVSGES